MDDQGNRIGRLVSNIPGSDQNWALSETFETSQTTGFRPCPKLMALFWPGNVGVITRRRVSQQLAERFFEGRHRNLSQRDKPIAGGKLAIPPENAKNKNDILEGLSRSECPPIWKHDIGHFRFKEPLTLNSDGEIQCKVVLLS